MAMIRRLPLASLIATAVALALNAGSAIASPIAYELPPEAVAFRPGPNLEAVVNNCSGCHSADYIATQPRGEKFKEDFWRTEVNKMIKVYGAPIADADVPKIVEYLVSTY
jgi:sulfite dehydrogenase (cytochrome) subunit B